MKTHPFWTNPVFYGLLLSLVLTVLALSILPQFILLALALGPALANLLAAPAKRSFSSSMSIALLTTTTVVSLMIHVSRTQG